MTKLLGVDIGGTHTDLILLDGDTRSVVTAKVPTTAGNQAEGLFRGVEALGVPAAEIDLLIHGTTVATNAVIERKGAVCGLITTAGFRDVLELRRRDRPHTYGLTGSFRPLIDRRLRVGIAERVSAEGEILTPVEPEAIRAAAETLRERGAEVVVVSFLNAYANPANERAAGEVLRDCWPNDYVVLGSEVLPAIREFERTSTAVVSGYVQPLIDRYFKRLTSRMTEQGYRRELLVVQSNGGVMSGKVAPRLAANTILSGPAAGVTAAAAIAAEVGADDAVSCDMGGTSLDLCIIRRGQPSLATHKQLDFGIPLSLPMLDIDAIGAGGGSLAYLDDTGVLQVGPESAGSDPGPACYGKGERPTITDALLTLGLLDPGRAIGKGHGVTMDPALARGALARDLGQPLGLSEEAAADAVLTVAGHKMAGHLRRRLIERGLDPRRFSLVCFGGAGPLFANRILRLVGLARAVVPYYPGITSALGCILGRLRHDFMQTVSLDLGTLDLDALQAVYREQCERGRALLAEEGLPAGQTEALLSADMCYRGQTHVVPVPLPPLERLSAEAIRTAFDAAYRDRYSQLLDRAHITLVNARVTVRSTVELPSFSSFARLPEASPEKPEELRRVHFEGGWLDCPVWNRHALAAATEIAGPALLLQSDSATFVEPGYRARVHQSGNVILEALA